MLLEYQLDQIKIVDFLLIAKLWSCLLFFHSPSICLQYFSFYMINSCVMEPTLYRKLCLSIESLHETFFVMKPIPESNEAFIKLIGHLLSIIHLQTNSKSAILMTNT